MQRSTICNGFSLSCVADCIKESIGEDDIILVEEHVGNSFY